MVKGGVMDKVKYLRKEKEEKVHERDLYIRKCKDCGWQTPYEVPRSNTVYVCPVCYKEGEDLKGAVPLEYIFSRKEFYVIEW